MAPSKMMKLLANEELLNSMRIYEDEFCVAVLSKKPASIAHVILFPKIQHTIMEQVSDVEIGHLFMVANTISRGMFESLNIQGTNILIQNGIAAGQEEPHFSIHILARSENDGIPLDWEPKQASQEDLATVELKYKQFTDGIVYQEDKPEGSSVIEEHDDEDLEGENYLLKYFIRKA